MIVSIIKSFAVGNGDMFYIYHNSQNFTIIDCCINIENRDVILNEISARASQKEITRVISTHPDEDHIRGLEFLDRKIGIINFYCVDNDANKDDETDSFNKYKKLRDSSKAFKIYKGCTRRWMNVGDEKRKTSGIQILWPDPDNDFFKAALDAARQGYSPNNISPIIQYSLNSGATALWMGDLETEFMEAIEDELDIPEITILFAPHHGRQSGRIPASLLRKMSPKIIVVGEADSEHIHYYPGYNKITQNLAGDIVFSCESGKVHVFTSKDYSVDFLDDESASYSGHYYVGTLSL